MQPDKKHLLGQILAQAEHLAAPDRDRYLREACAGDGALEAEARSLLAALGSAVGFLNSPTARNAATAPRVGPTGEAPGAVVGRYKLLQEIGEGGFGVVFLAEQREPVERRVAVKIIKLGMDTKQVVARFEAERQAVAMMDHPNIARVFDAGATDTGRPYFVMELVRGDPITSHCIANRLGMSERLELFEQVCRAVQHAHTKGIIHRDLKPGNVLVTMVDGKPVPKIIDFGIAKATGGRLTEKTYFTEHRQFIGTPEYMSPEQADNSGVDVDARTDIYSLGVLLYELLTGVTPLDPAKLRSAAWDELLRIIREEEPPRPSTRLSMGRAEAGQRLASHPSTTARQIRGDLDWIVMRCLEKERARRYPTAEALAADVRRHLAGEPVEAAPPSAAYRARKFARRHRGPLIAASLLLATIIAGGAVSAVLAVLESKARVRAQTAEATSMRRADELQKVVEFQKSQLRTIKPAEMGTQLKEDLLAEALTAIQRTDPAGAESRVQAIRDSLGSTNFTSLALKTLDRAIFSRSIKAIHEQFAEEPLVRANLLYAAARTMSLLGLFNEALPPMLEALDNRRHELGNDAPDTLESVNGAGDLLRVMGRLPEAEKYLREQLDTNIRLHGKDHEATLTSMSALAALLSDQDKFAEADPLFSEALTRSRTVLGADHRETLSRLTDQAFNLRAQGRLADAETVCRETAERCRRVLGPDDPDTLTAVNMLGSTLWAEHRPAEAEPFISEALTTARRTLGDDNPKTLDYLFNSGSLLRDLGNKEEAEKRFREAAERGVRVQGRDHPHTAYFLVTLADLQLDRHEFLDATASYESAAAGFAKLFGDSSSQALRARRGLGKALTELGRFAEAEPHLAAAQGGLAKDAKEGPLCAEALVGLYEKWDAADPGKGHADAAASWRAKLQAAKESQVEPGTKPHDR